MYSIRVSSSIFLQRKRNKLTTATQDLRFSGSGLCVVRQASPEIFWWRHVPGYSAPSLPVSRFDHDGDLRSSFLYIRTLSRERRLFYSLLLLHYCIYNVIQIQKVDVDNYRIWCISTSWLVQHGTRVVFRNDLRSFRNGGASTLEYCTVLLIAPLFRNDLSTPPYAFHRHTFQNIAHIYIQYYIIIIHHVQLQEPNTTTTTKESQNNSIGSSSRLCLFGNQQYFFDSQDLDRTTSQVVTFAFVEQQS